jgi:predicted DNA-binding ribbon-helix-helix protein
VSGVGKHSVSIRGHRTSFSLEDPFMDELRAIAMARGMPIAALIAQVDAGRPAGTNLSSALRLFVLAAVKGNKATGAEA